MFQAAYYYCHILCLHLYSRATWTFVQDQGTDSAEQYSVLFKLSVDVWSSGLRQTTILTATRLLVPALLPVLKARFCHSFSVCVGVSYNYTGGWIDS